ncbi:MAG: hypothetical protein AB8G18_03495 [Gammaproteobacteria bacterium]
MKTIPLMSALLISLMSFSASADTLRSSDVSVEVVNQRGGVLPTFDARRGQSRTLQKAYVEARPGQEYGIRITNHSNERLGFVVAVDGRNIISGKRSTLKRNERMYVLGPYQSATYRGWRSSRNRINEFYFTDEQDSYSAAFGDYSAMGVIAVAAFRDRERYVYEEDTHYESRNRAASPQRSNSPKAGSSRNENSKSAGTGYGDERYSRSRQVSFYAERRAAATYLYKYEWRDTLCEMGINRCYTKRNRLWDGNSRHADRGYATPPPAYRSFNYRRR